MVNSSGSASSVSYASSVSSSAVSNEDRSDDSTDTEVSARIAGRRPLTITGHWLLQAEEEHLYDQEASYTLGFVIAVMQSGKLPFGIKDHGTGGALSFTVGDPPAHITYDVRYLRDPNRLEHAAFIGVKVTRPGQQERTYSFGTEFNLEERSDSEDAMDISPRSRSISRHSRASSAHLGRARTDSPEAASTVRMSPARIPTAAQLARRLEREARQAEHGRGGDWRDDASTSSLSTAFSDDTLERVTGIRDSKWTIEGGGFIGRPPYFVSAAEGLSIPRYDEIQIRLEALDAFKKLDEKNAAGLFAALHPGQSDSIKRAVAELHRFPFPDFEGAIQNFKSFAVALKEIYKQNPKLRQTYFNQLCQAIFPVLPSQAALIAAIGEEQWKQRVPDDDLRMRYGTVLDIGDLQYAVENDSAAKLLQGPDAFRNFIGRKWELFEAEPNNANMKFVWNEWRLATFRLPGDDELQGKLNSIDLGPELKRKYRGLLIGIAEYSIQYLKTDTYLPGNQLLQKLEKCTDELKADIQDRIGAPTLVSKLIGILRRESAAAQVSSGPIAIDENISSMTRALSVIPEDEWKKFSSIKQGSLVSHWLGFDAYLSSRNTNLHTILSSDDPCRSFLDAMHEYYNDYCEGESKAYAKLALCMWRRWEFPLEPLDTRLHRMVDELSLSARREGAFRSLVFQAPGFAYLTGMDFEDFWMKFQDGIMNRRGSAFIADFAEWMKAEGDVHLFLKRLKAHQRRIAGAAAVPP